MPRSRRGAGGPVGLALAGGGPFGAVYEIGALIALEESIEGLDLNRLDCYVGVSAGGFLAAALANGITMDEMHRLFIADAPGEEALAPELFTRPAFREYLRRARGLPALLARSAWRYARHPLSAGPLASFAALGRAIPTGIFDNEVIHRTLEELFSRPGRSNDFRRLERRLVLVATDLDSGRSVSFGRPGRDRVPISRAVQASSALPGLYPPVEIGGHYYVDGALRKTLHASEALDDGMKLVLCVNPIVPFDAKLAAHLGRIPHGSLVDGGLPVVLSQTFRTVIHSRMTAGIARYRSRYRGAEVVLFEPESDDREIFFTNIFSYATRQRICEHAYAQTRRDLLARAPQLERVLARHGLRLRLELLADPHRRLHVGRRRLARQESLPAAAGQLGEALRQLRHWMAHEEARGAA